MQNLYAFIWGGVIAILGGLIGLGGAEFRLPVLAGVFKYRTLQAIVINLVVSLVTVIFSFIFRTGLTNLDKITTNYYYYAKSVFLRRKNRVQITTFSHNLAL